MPLQIAYTQADGSVCEHMLFEGRQYHIGRSGDADITIAHPQVSRLHACLQAQNDAHWTFSDTSSTGCFAHGKAISNLMINQVYTILLGPVACQLTPLAAQDVVRLDSQRVWREKQLTRHSVQLQQCTDSQALIMLAQECLQQSLGCERAAVILLSEDARSHQSLGFAPWMQDAGFTGSRTFIRQCLEQRSTLAVGSLADDKGLADQQSVIRFNIQAALAMPLMVNDNIVGVLYADSTQDKRFFTQADIALAQKLANLLSLRLLYHNIEHRINMLDKTRTALSPVAMH